MGLFIRLFKALKLEKANVVYIPGWGSREARFALFCSKILGFKSIVMSDSSEFDFQRNKLKEFIKKCFVNQFDAAFVAGSSHFNYILKLGMSANKITMGYDVVDNNHFSSHRSNVYKPDGYFLASGRFIKRKNFILLLEAYKDYRSKVKSPKTLVLCGSGHEESEIKYKIESLNLNSYVKLPGFVQYDELPVLYSKASVFIIPSVSEQWGLVINEAMASGLPILSSNRCGAHFDLVINNENGFIFNPFSVEDIANAMVKFHYLDCNKKNLFSNKSLEIIDNWSTDSFSTNFLIASKTAFNEK